MTEDFRCKFCDRILTQSDEWDLQECRECRDRTWKHLFDEADDGTCRACGFLESFGGLHVAPEPLYSGDDEPRRLGCRNCPHYQHQGPCRDALPGSMGRGRACPCSGERAVA